MKKYSFTDPGMLFVMFIGSGIGITAFAITENALFHTVTGFGIIFGLVTRSLLDRRKRQLT